MQKKWDIMKEIIGKREIKTKNLLEELLLEKINI